MIKTFTEFNSTINEDGFWDWLTGKSEKGDTKTQGNTENQGVIDAKVADFYKTLEDFASSNKSVNAQLSGKFEYSKMVENIQLALEFLGYKLEKYGVDGYFGPETAAAIDKFNLDTLPKIEHI
jgi:peptidoglycan hydrolase-like protein with peptidoglycan-binding domain